jgi:RNA polymerase sigma-70 factor, ECF subfamily
MLLAVESPPPAADLLQRAAAGQPDALADLYARYASVVHRAAYRLTASRADADDVLQDVFVGLPEALRHFGGRGSLEGWIRRVAVRAALMRMRGASRRREVPLEGTDAPAAGDPSAGIDRAVLERALSALPDALRVVFVLKEVEGYSHAEIGRLLGIREGASEVRLHRARKSLRTLLHEDR